MREGGRERESVREREGEDEFSEQKVDQYVCK